MVGAAVLFTAMAVQIRHDNPAWDRSLFMRFHEAGIPGSYSDPVGRLMRLVTRLGEGQAMLLVTFALLVLLAILRRPRAMVFVVVVPPVGALVATWLKTVFHHPRPDALFHYVPHLSSYSFPSGHTATATVVWLTAALLLVRYLSTRTAQAVGLVCATVPLLVALSRVYLGVHWPTDVIAGLAFGVAWVLVWHLVFFATIPEPPRQDHRQVTRPADRPDLGDNTLTWRLKTDNENGS
jgi:undecaprenyl-diphosphatase